MKVVEAKLEVNHVAEPVGLPLEGFDLVVDSLDNPIGDEVFEIVEKPCPVNAQGFGYFRQSHDS